MVMLWWARTGHALLAVGERCHIDTFVDEGIYSLFIDTKSFLAEMKFSILTVCT